MENIIKGKDGHGQEPRKGAPLYRRPAEYAREHDELALYRESNRANIACKEAIEDAVSDNYRDNRLDCGAILTQVAGKFSMERIEYVLANTVRKKDWDGRISRDNKAWAKTVPVCEETDAWGFDRGCCFAVDRTHPCLVDGLVSYVRRELAKAKEAPQKKPSVLEKLQKPAAGITGPPPAGRAKKSKEASL